MVAVILIHAYFGKPVEPWLPTEYELSEMTGIADFMYANPTKSAVGGYYLKVNGKVLNCDVGYYAARGGCNFGGVWWDKSKPVSATYFWMSTRWGFSDRMLHSLAQNGRQAISPQRTFSHRIRNYETKLEVYDQLFAFNVFLLALSWLIEWQYAKHNSNNFKKIDRVRRTAVPQNFISNIIADLSGDIAPVDHPVAARANRGA